MTPDEFSTAAIALLRSAVGWQTAIARRLDIDPRTVRRWLTEGAIPDWVDDKIAALIGSAEGGAAGGPRDEWIVGDGVTPDGKERFYIVHTAPPRFVARIVECDDNGIPLPSETPADVLSGTVYSIDRDIVLCEIEWIDAPPPGQVTHLMEAAGDALDEMTDRGAAAVAAADDED